MGPDGRSSGAQAGSRQAGGQVWKGACAPPQRLQRSCWCLRACRKCWDWRLTALLPLHSCGATFIFFLPKPTSST
jgi:hypothetical protein